MAVTVRQAAVVLALLTGAAVVGFGVDAATTAAKPAFDHVIEPADDADRIERLEAETSGQVLYDVQNLSAEGRRAVLAALDAPDGEATVRGSDDKPQEFEYTDTGAVGEGEFFLRYEGEYYVLHTSGNQFSSWTSAVPPLVGAAFVGGSALLAGVLGALGYDPRGSVSTFTGVSVAAVLVASNLVRDLDTTLFAGVVAGAVAWYGLGWGWRSD